MDICCDFLLKTDSHVPHKHEPVITTLYERCSHSISGFKKKATLPLRPLEINMWCTDRHNPALMWRSDFIHQPPAGCMASKIGYCLAWGSCSYDSDWWVQGRSGCLLACVSDSHDPTRQEVVLSGDDSSFRPVWDSTIWGQWHHPYLQMGQLWQEGSPCKASPMTFHYSLSYWGVEYGLTWVWPKLNLWGKAQRGGVGLSRDIYQCVSTKLMWGLFTALNCNQSISLN